MMQIRWAREEDAPALAQVFFDAVRQGDSPYSEAQRVAWMPAPPDPSEFAVRLRKCHVAVATVAGQPVGFMAMTHEGYFDLAFVLFRHRGRGCFRRLYDRLEKRAYEDYVPRLTVHASLDARPAFQSVGFSVITHETVDRAGETLRRAEMEKYLK